ncbi:hypothetical protein K474DRAFT_1752053 [Panus rudis PR-1116 ss-1]|nr:hypothetical protein K474DRAFT_1752053 [Panus rudis PR-1116 ss-1]
MSDNTNSSSTTITFPLLSAHNYSTWKSDVQAALRSKGLWRIVSGSISKPDDKEAEKLEAYLDKADRAAGILSLAVDKDQRVHLAGIEDDPVKIWAKLEIHMAKESLSALMTKVDDVMLRIKGLRPSNFDLTKMDDELAVMTLIRALPLETYEGFVRSLLLQKNLTKASIHTAFKNWETAKKPQGSEALSSASESVRSQSCCFCFKVKPHGPEVRLL